MVDIAICDDDADDLIKIKGMISKWQEEHGKSVRISTYESGTVLLHAVQDGNTYDLFILDILMPEMNGIELGLKLREEVGASVTESASSDVSGDSIKYSSDTSNEAPIIYLTSSPEFAVDSYDVGAFYYLLKPVSSEKFDEVFTSAIRGLEESTSLSITVRTKSGTYTVSYGEICYLELSRRTVHYVCKDRELYSVTVQEAFKEYTAPLMNDQRFFLCGASILVNLEYIRSIDKTDISFSNGQTLHIPRDSSKSLYKAWLDYWLEDGTKDNVVRRPYMQ